MIKINKQWITRHYKWLLLALFLILLAFWLFPRPLVQHPTTCEIISIQYRADDCDTLSYFYPNMGAEQEIADEELLQLLHRYRAFRELVPSTSIDGIPTENVTLWITISDNGTIKSILLGELSRLDVGQGQNTVKYNIIGAEHLLNEALGILKIS